MSSSSSVELLHQRSARSLYILLKKSQARHRPAVTSASSKRIALRSSSATRHKDQIVHPGSLWKQHESMLALTNTGDSCAHTSRGPSTIPNTGENGRASRSSRLSRPSFFRKKDSSGSSSSRFGGLPHGSKSSSTSESSTGVSDSSSSYAVDRRLELISLETEDELTVVCNPADADALSEGQVKLLQSVSSEGDRYKLWMEQTKLREGLTIEVGSLVTVTKKMVPPSSGVVRYAGPLEGKNGKMFGVELKANKTHGESDGFHFGKKLFDCEGEGKCALLCTFQQLRIHPSQQQTLASGTSRMSRSKPVTATTSSSSGQSNASVPELSRPSAASRLPVGTGCGDQMDRPRTRGQTNGRTSGNLPKASNGHPPASATNSTSSVMSDVTSGSTPGHWTPHHQSSAASPRSATSGRSPASPALSPSSEDGALKIGDKVVWIDDNGNHKGTVRWIGDVPLRKNSPIAGVEFDDVVGVGKGYCTETKKWHFETDAGHALYLPVDSLMKWDIFWNRDEKPMRPPPPVARDSSRQPVEQQWDNSSDRGVDSKSIHHPQGATRTSPAGAPSSAPHAPPATGGSMSDSYQRAVKNGNAGKANAKTSHRDPVLDNHNYNDNRIDRIDGPIENREDIGANRNVHSNSRHHPPEAEWQKVPSRRQERAVSKNSHHRPRDATTVGGGKDRREAYAAGDGNIGRPNDSQGDHRGPSINVNDNSNFSKYRDPPEKSSSSGGAARVTEHSHSPPVLAHSDQPLDYGRYSPPTITGEVRPEPYYPQEPPTSTAGTTYVMDENLRRDIAANLSIEQHRISTADLKQLKQPVAVLPSSGELGLGDMVEVGAAHPCSGVIKWIGYVPQSKSVSKLVAGIEVEEPISCGTDGVFAQFRLFQSPPNRALFVYLSTCRKDRRFVESGGGKLNFGALQTPAVPGVVLPPSTLVEIEMAVGEKRGIQGHHNSCYLDASLYCLFSFNTTFDSLLHRQAVLQDVTNYDAIQTVLRNNIVNPLRRHNYVRADNVLEFRKLLDKLQVMPGIMGEEQDPEEFLTVLFDKVMRAERFLHLNNGVKCHIYQILVEKDERVAFPTVQQLLDRSLSQGNVKFAEAPAVLIIQLPRSGKDKVYSKIFPTPSIDISHLLEEAPCECYQCGTLATMECPGCMKERGQSMADCTYCENCFLVTHQHPKRRDHVPVMRRVPKAAVERLSAAGSRHTYQRPPIPKERLELFAVLCIETSHYVAFVKCDDNTWIFFDSMADRQGSESGFNIPVVSRLDDMGEWLSEASYDRIAKLSVDRAGEGLGGGSGRHVSRLLCDGYICFYRSPDIRMYK